MINQALEIPEQRLLKIDYLDMGLPEQGHRKALLDPSLREIGVGSALYGVDQYFLVQDLACSQK